MAGKMRSPNYPALGLSQAIEAARKLWDKEKRTPVSHATAATALGYGSLSGPARIGIAALRQYGLVEKPDPGHVRLSERAVRMLHGSDEDKKKALVDAASGPKLFRELAATHLDGSDDAIRSYLITKKDFSEEGARKAVKSLRDTLALATPDASGYNAEEDEAETDDMDVVETTQKAKNAPDAVAKTPESGVFQLTVPFSKGTISVQVRVIGDAMRPSHLARVRKYLALAEDDWGTLDDEMGVPKAE